MNAEFERRLSGQNVFVTGANGFIGSHLVETVNAAGGDVTAFVRATSSGGPNNLDSISDDVEILRGDLQDPVSVRNGLRTMTEYSDVIIFHLGAQAHVGESWTRPHETLRTNIEGTLNLLEGVRSLDIDIKKFETAGTSEQYGGIPGTSGSDGDNTVGETNQRLNEDTRLNPMSVYATSKVAADFLTRNYHEAYGIPTVTTRMFNNYGPRQNPRYITGTIITQALERDIIELGNLEPKRDMCYVEDGVRGHIHVALAGKPGEVYTYGYGENITMRDWAEMILRIGSEEGCWDQPDIRQREERFRPGASEVQELKAGYQKLHELTGWEPEVTWEEGIRRTIQWYASNRPRWRGLTDW